MKLSWRDMVTTALALLGGAVVYAKFYDYSWALIGSWQSAVIVMAAIGAAIFAFSSFDFANGSVLNIGEMAFGVIALSLMILGAIMASEAVFYSLAAVMAAVWLVDTARHARHSLMDTEDTSSFQHHAHVH